MKRFSVSPNLESACVMGDCICGELFHIQRNSVGGSVQTPVARYFAWHPEFIEGFNKHWRVDCYFISNKLSPDAWLAGEALLAALINEKICSKPVWISVHRSEELKGKAYGNVFEDD
jgi:hypothetical protein